MATRKPKVQPQPEATVTPVALPEQVAGVHSNVTLRGVAAYQGKSDEQACRASIALAYVKASPKGLPPVREVEVATGISKSQVSRMVALGAILIALQPTIGQAVEVRYVYQGTRYGGSLKAIEEAAGFTLASEPERALAWFLAESKRLRALTDDETRAERGANPRGGKPDDGSKGKGAEVTIPATFENTVAYVFGLLAHLTGPEYETPELVSEEVAEQVKGIRRMAGALARKTGVEAVKPVRQAAQAQEAEAV